MNLGGPVWHCSTAPLPGKTKPKWELRKRALLSLIGVGDEKLGQWEEWTGKAYHIRRRLSDAEFFIVGLVLDVRGTDDGEIRFSELCQWLPSQLLPFATDEFRHLP